MVVPITKLSFDLRLKSTWKNIGSSIKGNTFAYSLVPSGSTSTLGMPSSLNHWITLSKASLFDSTADAVIGASFVYRILNIAPFWAYVSRQFTLPLIADMSILVYRIQLCKLAEYPNLYLQDIIWSLAPSNTTKIRCYRLSSAFFAFAFLVIDSAHGFVFWDRKKIVSLCSATPAF